MAEMSKDSDSPWWRSALRGIGVVAGLLALSVVLMGFIVFVARIFDKQPTAMQRIDLTTPAAPEQNAKTRMAPPYGPFTTPNAPNRPAAYKGDQGDGRGLPARPSAQKAEAAEPPVGIPVEQYRETVESGKKVYLPNPKGECDLSGGSIAKSADALDNCFAQRAAR